jgi:diphosphomevalonate decarboxylase
MTLDGLGTTTQIEVSKESTDQLIIDGRRIFDQAFLRLQTFLNNFRAQFGLKTFLSICSKNNIAYSSGLASSASSYAALTFALNNFFSLNLSAAKQSQIARLGSGSAARSIFGGFVSLTGGNNLTCADAIASSLDIAPNLDLAMLVLQLTKKEKPISSRDAMNQTKSTSPFYSGWLNSNNENYIAAKNALLKGELKILGEIMEQSTWQMIATMLTTKPAINYLLPQSLKIIDLIKKLREKENFNCYFTTDAGPHVKVLCPLNEAKQLETIFSSRFKDINIYQSKPGKAPIILDRLP